MKNFVQSCMLKIILESEIGNFSKNTLKITDYETLFYGYEYKKLAKNLLEEGAIFVEGDIKLWNTVKKHFGLVYKDESIKTVSEYGQKSDLIIDFWRLEGKKLIEKLDELYKFAKNIGSGGILKYQEILSRNMIKQEEWMSCAASCVKQLADDFGIKISEREIRILAKTTENGTDGADLFYAMQKVFNGKDIYARTFFDFLDDNKNFEKMLEEVKDSKFITNVGFYPNKHAIIVDKIIDEKVFIRDPFPLEVEDAFKKGIRGEELKTIFKQSSKGVEAIVKLSDFKKQ